MKKNLIIIASCFCLFSLFLFAFTLQSATLVSAAPWPTPVPTWNAPPQPQPQNQNRWTPPASWQQAPTSWIAPNVSRGYTLVESTISRGAQQNFERGFMVWIARTKQICYGTWNLSHVQGNFECFNDTFNARWDIIEDPTIVAPEGMYQPEFGFGKIWRTKPHVRAQLGWALDWGVDYMVTEQKSAENEWGSTLSVMGLNGGGYYAARVQATDYSSTTSHSLHCPYHCRPRRY